MTDDQPITLSPFYQADGEDAARVQDDLTTLAGLAPRFDSGTDTPEDRRAALRRLVNLMLGRQS